MKKIFALMLALAALTMTACSSEDTTDPSTDANDPSSNLTESETDVETEPAQEVVYSHTTVELAKDPVYENGMLVLYFTQNNLWYTENSAYRIGVVTPMAINTVNATPDFDAYPDMKTADGNYCGIALKPETEFTPGSYKFNISFGQYNVVFDMTIN